MENKIAKIKEMLKKSQDELDRYKYSRKFSNLSQACEKSWVAFNLLVEYKAGKELKLTKEIKNEAYSQGLEFLYERARYLHVLHYEGSAGLVEEEIIDDIQETIFNIKRELR